jgi:cytidylate kinase
MTKELIIAIDGPAASGKSTLAQSLAEKLGYLYFDTGAMYRAVTLIALESKTDLANVPVLEKIAREVQIDLRPPSQQDGRLYDVWINGKDRTWDIRTKEIDANVSPVSAVPGVRAALSEHQRRIGMRGGVVMAGRDIGTVVLPEADLKIYLDATPEERARRRHAELVEQGKTPSLEKILAGLRERDQIDSGRAVAPLRPADDAVMLKSDGLQREQVLAQVLEHVAKIRRKAEPESPEIDTQKPYQPAPKTRFFRWLLAPVFRVLFRILCGVDIFNKENVPTSGPYIIAYNHISNYEPPLLLAFWPEFPEAVAGHDVFDRGGLSFFVRGYGALPVKRGEYDRKIIDLMLWVLASGRPLLIAPEGGRSHQPGLREARSGVAYLMDRARVPVVPVGIVGTSDDMLKLALRGKRPRLKIYIGKPFELPPIEGRGEERRTARQANADLVMRHIAAVLPPEYWGIYKPI